MRPVVTAAVFLIVWQAGLSTLSPAYPHGDSGETAGVALHLGIAHPPGYPLPTLLSHLAVRLLPVGCVAWRVSLLSLAAAALAGALLTVALLVMQRGLPPLLAMLLGVTGGLALEIWNQMTMAKGSVYTVTIALLGALAVCLARLALHSSDPASGAKPWRWVLLFGLALGLGCGGHYPMLAPFVPFLFLGACLMLWKRPGALRAITLGLVALVLSASLYLYLPLRAYSAHPMFRWAEPGTWARFKWLTLRQQYLSIEQQSREGGGILLAARFADRFTAGFSRAGVLLLGLGVASAIVQRRWWLLAFGAGGCAEIAAAALYPKLEPDALWVADPFFSAGWFALALVLTGGLAWAAMLPGRWWRAAVAAGSLALVFYELRGGFQSVSKRWNYYATDQQANLASTLPPKALLFCEGDAYIAPLLYGLYVDGQRPDVRMIIPIFLHQDLSWGLRQLRAQYPDLGVDSLKPGDHIWLKAKDIMENHPERPWNYTLTAAPGWPFTPYATPYGLVFRIRGDPAAHPDLAIDRQMFRYRLRGTLSPGIVREPFAKVIRDNYIQAHFGRGIYRQRRNEQHLALKHFDRARRLGSPEAALNAGLLYYARGEIDRAALCWRQARDLAPDRPEPHVNLAVIALHQQPPQPEEAIRLCERAVALNKDFAKAYEMLARAWYMKGNLPRAIEHLKRAVILNPDNPGLRTLLQTIKEKG